jgi:drug/metabolite transporter (DMT)-like permease
MFLVFLLYALFASVFTISKTGLEYCQPFFFIGVRMVLAGALLIAYVFFFQFDKFVLKKKHFWKVIKLAAFNIYLTNTFEFWGLQYLTSFKTCFIYSLSPFVSALLSFMVLSEKLSPKKWLGLLIGFAGLMPVLLYKTTTEELAGHLFVFSWAEIAVMSAAICNVYGWLLLKQLVQENGYSPLMVNGISMFLGGILSLVHSFFNERWEPLPVKEALPFLECAILLIIISNLICYNLYGALLKRFSVTFMSFAGLSTPLFSAILGWIFLDELMPWFFYFSLTVLGFGLFIFYQEEFKQTVPSLQTNSIP